MSRGRPERLRGVPCEIVKGDIRDPGAVTGAVQGCDSVLHLAYLQGTQTFYANPADVLDVALRGIVNVLDACRITGCGDLLLVSSSEAYQIAPVVPTPEDIPLIVPDVLNPRYSYGGGKIACELAVLAWGRAGILDRVVIARPHNIYGKNGGYEHVIPEMGVRVRRLTAEHPEGPIPFPIQGTGQETRSFCHISDCTDAFALLLEKAPGGQGVWHIGNPEEITIERLVHLIGEHYNRTMKVIPGTLPKGSPPRRCPDISRMRSLGYEPKIPLGEGLGPVLDWYYENPQ
jgi:dTDP-glucose 4,6-dehydratase/UDP-glucose 4-epimerase